jgi:hypothetical protein
MALTVSSIASDSSIDIRQVLVATDTKFIGWIDRIHKDCMHSSVYSPFIVARQSLITIAGQSNYTLAPTAGVTGAGPGIRRILGVFDSTRNRILFPIERATSPISQVDKQEPSPGQQGSPQIEFGQPLASPISLQAGQPGYFRYFPNAALNPPAISLIPTPAAPLTISVTYELQVVTLVNPTDTLLVPEDGRDMVVAGVNYLANIFLKRMDEAQIWAQIYSALKKGESLV